jgi:glycosyltransferase involved in cell wall biosynthesis
MMMPQGTHCWAKEGATDRVFEQDRETEAATPDSEVQAPPRVSIGMPVFNGENYIRQAIESILAQSFTDFELIVCDNASTDSTPEICRAYAARDRRVRYVRNPRNLGAGPNFDLCFHLARGTYFQWTAHDDMRTPDCLARAVEALERHPDAVLCVAGIIEIGADGAVRRRYATGLDDITSSDPARRFGCVINARHQCEDFFGVYRRSALLGSPLIGAFTGADRVVLAEAALRGPWIRLPDYLFLHREHAARATRALLLVDRAASARWVAAEAKRAQDKLFHLVLYRRYIAAVRRNVPPGHRWGCYRELLRWWFADGHFADVLRDILQAIHPHLLVTVRRVKRAAFGRSHDRRPGSLPTLDQ